MGLKNRKYFVEYLGTMFLVLVYGMSGDAIALGFTLSALIYVGALTSGAHFNPVISLAAFLLKKITPAEFGGYFIAQLLGAFTAGLIIKFLSGILFYVEAPFNTLFYQQVTLETLLTFIFVLVALVAWIGKSEHKSVATYSFIMGFCLIGIISWGQDISGAILNPAISLSTSALDFYFGGASYLDIPLYTIAPIIGSVAATFVYKNIINDVD